MQDLDCVMALWLETNIAAHHFIDAAYWRENANAVRGMMPQATIFVDEAQGAVRGFVGLIEGAVAGIFVASDCQSKGIGKALLDAVKEGRQALSLSVYQKNTRALGFYLREGFVVHREEIDQNTGEIELFMRWTR